MEVTLKITKGGETIHAAFHSNVDAMEVYTKLWDALLDGEDQPFTIALEVPGDE